MIEPLAPPNSSWPNVVLINGLAFHLIAKNATLSIRDALLRSMGIEKQNIQDFDGLECVYKTQSRGYKIGFIRNPIDRAVSTWRNKLHAEGVVEKPPLLLQYGFEMGCSFDDYIRDLRRWRFLDKHTAPQIRYIRRPEEMDYLGRMEDLPMHWKMLQLKYRWLPDLKRLNATAPMELSQSHRAALMEMYEEDYVLWQSLALAK